jgi:signal peptidase
MKESENKKKKNPLHLIVSLVETLLIIGLISVALLSFGTRIPLFAKMGVNFFAVTSGSMEPNIHTGSVIYVGRYKLEDLKSGDVITYSKASEDKKQASVVTHRIASINKEEIEQDGKKTNVYTIKTKGDANSSEDEYTVSPGEIIGLYKWNIPKLGYVTTFAQTPQGFVVLVLVPAAILILWEVISLITYFKAHYENKSKSEIARLKAELEKSTLKHAE